MAHTTGGEYDGGDGVQYEEYRDGGPEGDGGDLEERLADLEGRVAQLEAWRARAMKALGPVLGPMEAYAESKPGKGNGHGEVETDAPVRPGHALSHGKELDGLLLLIGGGKPKRRGGAR